MDMREVRAQAVVGERVPLPAVFGVGHGQAHTAKRAPEGARCVLPRREAHHFCELYQSSMSLRTWSLAIP